MFDVLLQPILVIAAIAMLPDHMMCVPTAVHDILLWPLPGFVSLQPIPVIVAIAVLPDYMMMLSHMI
jgi:hypothetical protein